MKRKWGLTFLAALLLLSPVPASATHTGDRNCADFATQEAAQDHFFQHPGDPDNLDADDDNYACEENIQAVPPTFSRWPDSGPVGTEIDVAGVCSSVAGGVGTTAAVQLVRSSDDAVLVDTTFPVTSAGDEDEGFWIGTITVPQTTLGAHELLAECRFATAANNFDYAARTFTVTAAATPTPTPTPTRRPPIDSTVRTFGFRRMHKESSTGTVATHIV